MKKKIRIIVADPAGNITIFVDEPFPRSEYQKVASQLLAMPELRGEQVAFIQEAPVCGRADGKMEMCGLEFCGNASRSFGLLLAKRSGLRGKGQVFVDISGCSEILTIEVDTESNDTKVKMPSPREIKLLDLRALFDDADFDPGRSVCREDLSAVRAVDFGGILHVILKDIPATETNFAVLRRTLYAQFDPPAMGVMFCDSHARTLTPVVYVKDVDTTYFEGSCGSGSTACAAAFSLGRPDGTYTYTFPQPAGTIASTVVKQNGRIEKVFIEGTVQLSEPMEIEVEI